MRNVRSTGSEVGKKGLDYTSVQVKIFPLRSSYTDMHGGSKCNGTNRFQVRTACSLLSNQPTNSTLWSTVLEERTVPQLVENPQADYRVHQRPTLVPIPSQTSLVHALQSYFFKVYKK